jgi:molybdopterin-guanine dinucleotide biosynthesis protein A
MTSGAILAGGRATRFGGRDKRTLLVGGRSILHRQLAALSSAADEILVAGLSAASTPRCTPRGASRCCSSRATCLSSPAHS